MQETGTGWEAVRKNRRWHMGMGHREGWKRGNGADEHGRVYQSQRQQPERYTSPPTSACRLAHNATAGGGGRGEAQTCAECAGTGSGVARPIPLQECHRCRPSLHMYKSAEPSKMDRAASAGGSRQNARSCVSCLFGRQHCVPLWYDDPGYHSEGYPKEGGGQTE